MILLGDFVQTDLFCSVKDTSEVSHLFVLKVSKMKHLLKTLPDYNSETSQKFMVINQEVW